jgi:hypothetical protein
VVEPPQLNRPSRGQIYRRRVVAIAVLTAAIAVAIWAGWTALEDHDKAAQPAASTRRG